ncbi:hypothetical protein [Candidatus Uabimicrobium sp. HlEnr_7]|uniref:hypothetical protein n=1 Tax=Candidatus Uabimicrobium helgolandensis TaxID=3095367 RepID=UPI00355763D1
MLRYKVYIVVALLLLINTQHYINPCCIQLQNSQECNKAQASDCCNADTSSCCETNTDNAQECCICCEDTSSSINYTVLEQRVIFYKHLSSNIVFLPTKKTTLFVYQPILPPTNILQQSSILLC